MVIFIKTRQEQPQEHFLQVDVLSLPEKDSDSVFFWFAF